jgi:hypothetical protein
MKGRRVVILCWLDLQLPETITEILLKVALNTITLTHTFTNKPHIFIHKPLLN